eukprot:gnl/TRDRNA2_/TRDRNA2_157407_c0_seq1.p1 gnl/TRDRNA2_/TRDRNA2_157407_c0~~gnl/TRDRNA2_/TRDRNA2_157407_c0_seq1.p1  ORF type:complete len:899 (+),score=198.52 gnl/TRDRNA2_/TRDRNA2_157407_c0_seq1:45-2741(+)
MWQGVWAPLAQVIGVPVANPTPPSKPVVEDVGRLPRAPPNVALVPGARVEAEWLPGRKAYGVILEVLSDGRLAIRYDDGYTQPAVAPEKVRLAGPPPSNDGSMTPPRFRLESDKGSVKESPPLPPPPPSADSLLPSKRSADVGPRGTNAGAGIRGTGLPQDLRIRPIPIGDLDDADDGGISHDCHGGYPSGGNSVVVTAGIPRVDASCFKCCEAPPQVERPIQKATRPNPPPPPETAEPDFATGTAFQEVRQWLAEATSRGNAVEIQAALDESQRVGFRGPQVGRARDALLALESSGVRADAERMVDEAIESDDWWKMQAAMATAVGSGLGQEVTLRLKEAMRTHKKRQEAVRQLRDAEKARDPSRLRTALEAAILVHVNEPHVKRAREAIRALEAQEAIKRELRKATSGKGEFELNVVIKRAEAMGLGKADEEGSEVLHAACQQLKSQVLERLEGLRQSGNLDGLEAALAKLRAEGGDGGDAGQDGGVNAGLLDVAELDRFNERLATLREHDRHRQHLRKAIQDGEREGLLAAAAAASSAGLGDAELRPVREALQVLEARQKMQVGREAAAKELQDAAHSDEIERLMVALSVAESVGLHGAEAVPARERLRVLRARAAALRELQEAAQGTDVYKLRATIATAKSAGIGEAELNRAKTALRVLEAQVHARHALDAAVASRDPDVLRAAISDGKGAGLAKHEVERAESVLQALAKSHVGDELRAAMEVGDLERLRAAASAATNAGVISAEVRSAWEEVHRLESLSWIRRELQNAVESSDSVRLQAAIRQAEASGTVSAKEIATAKEALDRWVAQQAARQGLQLARASGSSQSLRAALQVASDCGLRGAEVEAAQAALQSSVAPGSRPSSLQAQHSHAGYSIPATEDSGVARPVAHERIS